MFIDINLIKPISSDVMIGLGLETVLKKVFVQKKTNLFIEQSPVSKFIWLSTKRLSN